VLKQLGQFPDVVRNLFGISKADQTPFLAAAPTVATKQKALDDLHTAYDTNGDTHTKYIGELLGNTVFGWRTASHLRCIDMHKAQLELFKVWLSDVEAVASGIQPYGHRVAFPSAYYFSGIAATQQLKLYEWIEKILAISMR
jgi:hypothetical protein